MYVYNLFLFRLDWGIRGLSTWNFSIEMVLGGIFG